MLQVNPLESSEVPPEADKILKSYPKEDRVDVTTDDGSSEIVETLPCGYILITTTARYVKNGETGH